MIPDFSPLAYRRRGSKHDYDPRWRNITRQRNRYAVKIAGGRRGQKQWVGLFATLDEAIRARDAAEQSRRAA